ncbi:hypothetical protein JTE90_026517 [Oedothorax gibbosus]|uniref:Uncharacterized protein n=1 Tax=Oedothorax gibbosus TaxID=931172 RepID=A0AAV6VR38_9ARAC|nr:hypothetical protein JTE90_026517 [Oedothorax gibbosus]
MDSGPNVEASEVLQELSQNDLHGLVPEEEAFELESLFAVISSDTKNLQQLEEDLDTACLFPNMPPPSSTETIKGKWDSEVLF